jgi:hypothetical protein
VVKLLSARTSKKIPAVTRVEEWTIAEIGVGADMAAGSHLESGNWALFLKAQITAKNKITHVLKFINKKSLILESLSLRITTMTTSPNRLKNIVNTAL